MSEKLILWDIDGTLLNTSRQSAVPLHLQVVMQLGSRLSSIPFVSAGMTDSEILERLLILSEINIDSKVLSNALEVLDRLSSQSDQSTNFLVLPGVIDTLERFISASWRNGILTGNTLSRTNSKLRNSNLAKFFETRYIFSCLPGEIRQDISNRVCGLLLKSGITDVIIIGDTPADIRIARNAGYQVIAVASGIHSFLELEHLHPDLLIENLEYDITKVTDFIISQTE